MLLPTVYLNGTSRLDGQEIDDLSSSGGNDLQWLLLGRSVKFAGALPDSFYLE